MSTGNRQGPGVCRLYLQNQRCKYGNKCKFLHQRDGDALHATTSQISPSSVPTPRNTGAAQPNAHPRGACKVYWDTGNCRWSFDCSFKHVKGPAAGPGTDTPQAKDGASEDIWDSTDDFFSVEGLAAISGVRLTEHHSLNPSEAHNMMKDFLRDNYHFQSASKIQGFVRILASINSRNKSWNSDKAQAFLEMLVSGNGIIRIGDVLRYEPVGERIGHNGDVLSFQAGYFPILEYFASDLVLKSTLHKNINHLYTVIDHNYDSIHAAIHRCVGNMVSAKSWNDTTPNLIQSLKYDLDGVTVFKSLTTMLLQYLNRFKDVLKSHPELATLVEDISGWFELWSMDVSSRPAKFSDSIVTTDPASRRLILSQIREEVSRLTAIVRRETIQYNGKSRGQAQAPQITAAQRRRARIMQLGQSYDPPGTLREEGSRHDNDHANIRDIRIAPTHNELLCPLPPYLPVFLPDAPHHLPEHSMERHLDIQFRLLREELIAPIRSSINAIYNDLGEIFQRSAVGSSRPSTKLEKILKMHGGAYKTSGYDSLFFQIYTDAQFAPPRAQRRSLTVGLDVAAPAGAARDKDVKKRTAYWEHSKRLQSGSLIALVLVSNSGIVKVFLGVTSSFNKDIAESVKDSKDTFQIQVSFFDPEVELRALGREQISDGSSKFAFLVDNSVMYESSRPFLERLHSVEPTEIPFARYIAHSGDLHNTQMRPPQYATAPTFRFKLQCLAKQRSHMIPDLSISQPDSVARTRRELLESSILDPSQAEALLNTLTSELSLIQGPPGTGKSFTGKEILHVLFASGVKPVVLISYTNHALDHMLTNILDAGVTNKFVRLGSRSSNEQIAEYTLDKLEKVAGPSELDRSVRRQYAVMKGLEEEMTKVMRSMQLPSLSWEEVQQYLNIQYPDHAYSFESPPFWVRALTERLWEDEDKHGEWQTAGKKKSEQSPRSIYAFWRDGEDLDFISILPLGGGTEVLSFFAQLEYPHIPPVPNGNRTLEALKDISAVWSMSLRERHVLADQWEEDIRSFAYTSNLDRYNLLREDYTKACQHYNDIRDDARRRLLAKVDLIGCTTTGAAKLTSLLNSIRPRVLLVEEAGQVLEAHILTSLVPSVQHLICIGDPQQLRPTLATFSLSMDSERGRELFKFDRSLMERLSDAGLPMSQINVQRRMQPQISHFIRRILYPKLEDHDVVTHYPPVTGMQKNVFFLNHKNPESGAEDSVSKFNTYEVDMIKDLVMHFLRQDEYNGPGDIAVLCAYLGQLQKVRAALRDLKLAVAIDERDEEQLEKQGLEDDVTFEQVVVAQHIRLGTVDIFQGQEAKIVIVSLVRNTGTFETDSASIGFLRSSNRINVALSRAKHGLYILGNASNLRRNDTWSTIVDDLEAREQLGPALPIVCPRHPNHVHEISKPGDLGRYAPLGGCLEPCGSQLRCGHTCPSICHSTRDNHRSTRCNQPCSRAPCPRSHPCTRKCSDPCGDCDFPIPNVPLPCGHVAARVPCHKLEKLDKFKCMQKVTKALIKCEHSAVIPCHQDPANVQCKEICGGVMQCCSRTCKSRCFECQRESAEGKAGGKNKERSKVNRTKHRSHACERYLYCQHECGLPCSNDHQCNPECKKACRQQCSHHKCAKPCSAPCAPCMEPCLWRCPHASCPVSCGSICSRLPCDYPCSNTLECGHPCPSVCGEPCQQQRCPRCMPSADKQDIVDLIMQRRLEEIDLTSDDVSERLITLACKHIFTVETLDGHCGMSTFYETDPMTGRFISTKAPPTSYQTPVTCPTCRGAITAPRYGRVTKRATLDILEQNVASTMSRELEALNPRIEQMSAALEKREEDAKKIAVDAENITDVAQSRQTALTDITTGPLPKTFFDRNAMVSIHGFSSIEAKAWHAIVKDIVNVYGKAQDIATTRSAHVKAYEGALTTLYHLERKDIANDPERSATDNAEQLAFEAVNKKIGQPPHNADCRFQIEGFIRTLELRFMIAQIGYKRIDGLSVAATEQNAVKHGGLWTSFLQFVYDSCVADAQKAFSMAEKTKAWRQAARCSIYILRSQFEQFRFETMTTRDQVLKADNPRFEVDRDALADRVKAKKVKFQEMLREYEKQYIRSRPVQTTNDVREERQWFKENCQQKAERFIRDLEALEDYVRRGGGYQPLSMQEREEIVKAFSFGYTGHFYNCPNGHPFVITECGGAMQQATCPECRLPIGGGDHRLLSSNTAAREFEDLVRAQGASQGYY